MIAARGRRVSDRMPLGTSVLIAALVAAGALFGMSTRPAGLLATVWPANALFLGGLVRSGKNPTWLTWSLGAAALVGVNLAMGDSWPRTVLLSTANITGVAMGYIVYANSPRVHRRLDNPDAVLFMGMAAATASAGAGLVGSIANPVHFGGSRLEGFSYWSVTEFVNYLIILPAILTTATLPRVRDVMPAGSPRRHWVPVAALGVSCALAVIVGGPGALAFPVPAMLWCALTYRLSTTAYLTLGLSVWTLLAISNGLLDVGASFDSRGSQMSLRLGVALMSLAPLVTASITAARNRLLRDMAHRASHDPLTGLLNRAGFTAAGHDEFNQARASEVPLALMVLDVDHFKRINDTSGHAAGDRVLVDLARRLEACVRTHDRVGRIGGEEFAVLLPGCPEADARVVATRILDCCSDEGAPDPDDFPPSPTVSIGLVALTTLPETLDDMFRYADDALYEAKRAGRNCVAVFGSSETRLSTGV